MTVPSLLTASEAFPVGLHGFYPCRPVGRGKRENKGGQNLNVAFWLILNKTEKRATVRPQLPLPPTAPQNICPLALVGFQGAFTRNPLSPPSHFFLSSLYTPLASKMCGKERNQPLYPFLISYFEGILKKIAGCLKATAKLMREKIFWLQEKNWFPWMKRTKELIFHFATFPFMIATKLETLVFH